MGAMRFHVQLCFSSWLTWYLRAVILFAVITRKYPDEKKLVYWIRKGLSQRVVDTGAACN